MDHFRNEKAPRTPEQFTTLHAFLWMLGAVLAVVLFIGFVHSLLPRIGRDLVSLGALSAVSFLSLAAWLTHRYPGGERLADVLGIRGSHPLAVPLSLLIGCAARAPAEGLRRVAAQFVEVSAETQEALGELTAVHSPTHAVFLFAVMAFLVPCSEEIFFRGAVYGALRRGRTSALRAAFVTSLGFALSHPQAILPIGLMACIFGFLRASSGSLLPALGAHVAFNAVEVVEMSSSWDPQWSTSEIGVLSCATVGLLTVFAGLVWRSPAARLGRQREADSVVTSTVQK